MARDLFKVIVTKDNVDVLKATMIKIGIKDMDVFDSIMRNHLPRCMCIQDDMDWHQVSANTHEKHLKNVPLFTWEEDA